jgi:hypothetical protein
MWFRLLLQHERVNERRIIVYHRIGDWRPLRRRPLKRRPLRSRGFPIIHGSTSILRISFLSMRQLKLLTCGHFNWGEPLVREFRNEVAVVVVGPKPIEHEHLRPFGRRFSFTRVNSIKPIVVNAVKLRRDSFPNRKLGRQTKKKSDMPDSNFVDAVHLLVHNVSDADDSDEDGSDDDGCDAYDESDEWLPRSGSRITNIDIQRRKIEQHRESTDNVKKRKKTNAPRTLAKAHVGNCRTGEITRRRARRGGEDVAVLHVDKIECKKRKRSPQSSTGKRSGSAARTTYELPGVVECTTGVLAKLRKNTMVDDNIDSEVQTARVEALYKRRLAPIAKRRVRLEEEDAALESSAGEYCKSWKRLDEFTQITWGEDNTSSDEEEWQEVNKGRFENLAVAKSIPLSISLSPMGPNEKALGIDEGEGEPVVVNVRGNYSKRARIE